MLRELPHNIKQKLAEEFKLPIEIFDEMYIDELTVRSEDGTKEIVLRNQVVFEGIQEDGDCDPDDEKEPWQR